ncbi:MAG: DUF1622 domain-containing protein [Acidimicrobiales bacterium]
MDLLSAITLAMGEDEGPRIGDFELARVAAELIEIAAIILISIAVVTAVLAGLRRGLRSDWTAAFDVFKRAMARGLLSGLDLLIAADIIKTVTLEATLENIAILGLLVVIRTSLSWSLVVELDGRWPWQPKPLPE